MPLITVKASSGEPVTYRLDQDVITIGRSASNDLLVRDPLLSRFHAEVRRTDKGWVVDDCDSSNGTLLNGRAIRDATRLDDGDEIQLGRTVLVFASAGSIPGEEKTAAAETDRITWSASRSGLGDAPMLIGEAAKTRKMLDVIARIAGAPGTALITGENGTGKELVARMIHRSSPRADGPFVVVNCPALPGPLLESELFGVEKGVATGVEPRPGLFEVARGGTLLLDEVGDLHPDAQAKILRALQEKKVTPVGARRPLDVDVRILAATNHDLEADIEAGKFRRDLYHRLNVFSVTVPPLRERREDIPLLIDHFLSSDGPQVEIDPKAMKLLVKYEFPGNVRELEHVIESARFLARDSVVRKPDLPEPVREGHVTAVGAKQSPADRLYDRIVYGGESFWEVVHGPYLRREVSRDDVRGLIARAHDEARGSYKRVAEMFRIRKDYKMLLNFLRNHQLGVRADE